MTNVVASDEGVPPDSGLGGALTHNAVILKPVLSRNLNQMQYVIFLEKVVKIASDSRWCPAAAGSSFFNPPSAALLFSLYVVTIF